MTSMDTIKAVSIPSNNIVYSVVVYANPPFTSFNRLAPSMTGTDRINVNSADIVLDTPISNAPTIVAPDLDVPGNTAAIN